jgi:hypothetical protein
VKEGSEGAAPLLAGRPDEGGAGQPRRRQHSAPGDVGLPVAQREVRRQPGRAHPAAAGAAADAARRRAGPAGGRKLARALCRLASDRPARGAWPATARRRPARWSCRRAPWCRERRSRRPSRKRPSRRRRKSRRPRSSRSTRPRAPPRRLPAAEPEQQIADPGGRLPHSARIGVVGGRRASSEAQREKNGDLLASWRSTSRRRRSAARFTVSRSVR